MVIARAAWAWPLLGVLAAACAPEEPLTPPLSELQPHCEPSDSDTDLEFGVDFPDPDAPGVDYDCDGWPVEEDCDDQDPDVHPGATEYNNARDDDCNGDAEPLYGCGITSYEADQAVGGQRRFAILLPFGLWASRRRRRGNA